ncbi:MAG: hypothetical protein ACREL5_13105 [Gemmatimonadales bacterium]
MRHADVIRWASAATAAILLAACGSPSAKPANVDVTMADYSISAPAAIPAGMVTFTAHNTGAQLHQAALVRLDSGKTAADFTAALMQKGGPPPPWIVWMGGLQNNSVTTLGLEPGSYVWYCLIPDSTGVPHVARGMLAPMTVTPASGPVAPAPAADIDVTMHDYQWDFSKPITAGHHVFKVSTLPGQPHEWVVIRLKQGATLNDVLAWAAKPSGFPAAAEWIGGIPILQAGQVNYATIDFTPGHYAFVCFVPDATDGQPHAAHGMVKDLVIQ